MENVLRLAIVDPGDSTRESLKAMLLGLESIWLEAECSRYEFFPDVVEQTNPDIALISLDSDPDKALDLVSKLRTSAPQCSVFVASASTDGSLILRAMRAGAKEFLTQPLRLDDLVEALDRLSEQRSGEAGSRGSAVIAVAGVTGGVGSTSIAVNLACALARDPQKTVALVDLDLCLGDADVFLDTIPDYTIVDVAENVSRLDFSLLKRSLTKHSSGLYLLPRPLQMQDVPLVNADGVQRVIGLLKATFSHLVIDLSKGYSQLDMAAISLASHVLLVSQLDLPCLRNVVRLLMSFNDYDGLSDKVKIVINRMGFGNSQISLKKAQETIGRDIFRQISNDYRTMIDVRNNGIPLMEHAPKAAITQEIIGLADALSGGAETAADPDAQLTKSSLGKLLGFWGKDKGGK